VSQADAAKKLDVSVESVKRAKVVKDKGAPETIAAVETGQLAVKPAAKIAREPKEKQPALVKAAGERSSRKSPKTEVQRKADKYLRERQEHNLESFARALVERFREEIPQLLTWLEEFSNVATAGPPDLELTGTPPPFARQGFRSLNVVVGEPVPPVSFAT